MNKKALKKAGTGLMAVGLILLIGAAALVCYNLWDDSRAAAYSNEVLQQFPVKVIIDRDDGDNPSEDEADAAAETPLYVLNPDMEMPTTEIDGSDYIGRLDIPALGLSLPIMSQWSYPNLRLSPCRYSGSAYEGNFIIAGHNYKSHFGTLRDLTYGDTILFTDMDGNTFIYQVAEIEQLAPTKVAEMKDGGWALTLFTCTVGGANRVTVRCTAV